MKDLPREVKYEILGFLMTIDLTNVMVTSKGLKSAAEEPLVWREKWSSDDWHFATGLSQVAKSSILQNFPSYVLKLHLVFDANSRSMEKSRSFRLNKISKAYGSLMDVLDEQPLLPNTKFIDDVEEFHKLLLQLEGEYYGILMSIGKFLVRSTDDDEHFITLTEQAAEPEKVQHLSEWLKDVPTWAAAVERNIHRQKPNIVRILCEFAKVSEKYFDILNEHTNMLPIPAGKRLTKAFPNHDWMDLCKPKNERKYVKYYTGLFSQPLEGFSKLP